MKFISQIFKNQLLIHSKFNSQKAASGVKGIPSSNQWWTILTSLTSICDGWWLNGKNSWKESAKWLLLTQRVTGWTTEEGRQVSFHQGDVRHRLLFNVPQRMHLENKLLVCHKSWSTWNTSTYSLLKKAYFNVSQWAQKPSLLWFIKHTKR